MKEAQGDSAGWKQNTRLRIWSWAKRWTVSWCVQSALQISLLEYGNSSFQLLPGWQSLPITIDSWLRRAAPLRLGRLWTLVWVARMPCSTSPTWRYAHHVLLCNPCCRCESCMQIASNYHTVSWPLSGHHTQHMPGQKLMRVSAMQDGFVSDIAEHVQVGMQIKARVINVDPGTNKVGLTMRSPESEEARVERQARRAERSERFGGGGERAEPGDRGQAPVQARMRRAPKGAARACIPGQGSSPVHTAVYLLMYESAVPKTMGVHWLL